MRWKNAPAYCEIIMCLVDSFFHWNVLCILFWHFKWYASNLYIKVHLKRIFKPPKMRVTSQDTWASWFFRSQANQHFVQELVHNNNRDIMKVLYHWPFVRSPVNFPYWGPVMQKAFLCHCVIININQRIYQEMCKWYHVWFKLWRNNIMQLKIFNIEAISLTNADLFRTAQSWVKLESKCDDFHKWLSTIIISM